MEEGGLGAAEVVGAWGGGLGGGAEDLEREVVVVGGVEGEGEAGTLRGRPLPVGFGDARTRRVMWVGENAPCRRYAVICSLKGGRKQGEA